MTDRVIYNGIDFTAMVDAAIAARRERPRSGPRILHDHEKDRIRELRERHGLPASELARLARCAPSTIHNVLARAL